MATSGIEFDDYNVEQVISAALFLCEALEEGEPITGEHTVSALQALNRMLSAVRIEGTPRWLKTEGFLFMNPRQSEYVIGRQGTLVDRAAKGSFGYALLSAPVATATVVVDFPSPLSPIPAMAINDHVGVLLSSGERFWSQVAALTATGCLLADVLPAPGAAIGATVFWYTEHVTRPMRVLNAQRGGYRGATVPIDISDIEEIDDQPVKNTAGPALMVAYQPMVGEGKVTLWPSANSADNVISFRYLREFERVTSTSQTLDWPAEWLEAIEYGLAARLAPQYSLPMAKRQALSAEAAEKLAVLALNDESGGSIYIEPRRQ